MSSQTIEKVDCDVLIIGGGMAGCGAAYEAKYWGKDLNVVLVEKSNLDRKAMSITSKTCFSME